MFNFTTLISILILISGAFISLGVASFCQTPISFELPRPGIEYTPKAKKPAKPSFLFRLVPFSPWLLHRLRWEVRIKRQLDAGHVRMLPAEFFNFKLLLMIIIALLPLVIFRVSIMGMHLGFGLLGYLLPDIFLRKKINKRKRLIVKQLPEAVDLIGLCIEAGLDFNSALRWIVEKLPATPLIEEFTFMLEEIKWGKPRMQALKDMSKRLSITEVSSLVLTLSQAERMGTPVAEAFTILSEDTRLQRFHRGERIALKAPIKILIPLIFFILPVIGIVIAAPILLDFMSGKGMEEFTTAVESAKGPAEQPMK